MSVTEQVSDGRPQPGEGSRAPRDVRLRPLVAAGVVLLLWFAWLLVPSSSAPGTPDAPGVAGDASDAGIQAQLYGDGTGAGTRPGAAATAAGEDGSAAEPSAGPAGPAPATSAAPAPVESAPVESGPVESGPAEPAPVESAPVVPAPVVVPEAGDGTFAVAPGGTDRVGDGGTLVTYSVEVEGGVPLDVAAVAEVVDGVLADPRSWTAQGEWSLQRTDADPDVRIRVASPDTTDRLCAPLRTRGQVSCRNGDDVALNAIRWTRGATPWGDDVTGYREYLVNHELGHYLGLGHVQCPAEGEAAPVMLQQTLGLQGCAPNGWPFP